MGNYVKLDLVTGDVLTQTRIRYIETQFAEVCSVGTVITAPVLLGPLEKAVALTISSNVLTIDMQAGSLFTFTMNANITTTTLNNKPASGNVGTFAIKMTANGTGYTWAWLTSTVKWPGSVAPTMTTTNAKLDFYAFETDDNGTTWFGSIIGQRYL